VCGITVISNFGVGRSLGKTRVEMGLRLFFVLCDGEVKMDDSGVSPGGNVSREKVISEDIASKKVRSRKLIRGT
jgi:hypothetical protein